MTLSEFYYNLVTRQKHSRIHMANTNDIAKLVGFKDENIELNDEIQIIEEDCHTTTVLSGRLSYQFEACPKCGVRNKSTQDMIKYETYKSRIKLPSISFGAHILEVKKLRYLCKHCGKTTVASTTLIDYDCCIFKILKQVIAMKLSEIRSITLIARRYSVCLIIR